MRIGLSTIRTLSLGFRERISMASLDRVNDALASISGKASAVRMMTYCLDSQLIVKLTDSTAVSML